MAELREPKAENRSQEQSDVEDADINDFNHNTDYDDRSALESDDPFSAHNLAIQQFITTARVYDCLLALIRLQSPDTARDLLELHAAGHLLATAPGFSGVFLTDEMNIPEETDDVH